jgi:hypothetical protein
MKNLTKPVIIAFIVCLFAGHKVWGQIGNPGLMYQGAFNNAMFLTTKSAIEAGMKNTPGSGSGKSQRPRAAVSDLNFISSAKVHDRVLNLIATIAANGDKNKINTAANTISNANFMAEFERILKPYGLNRHNVPDVSTAFIILSWQAISGKDAGNYRQGIALFRNQINSAMRNNSSLSEFTNDQKQEISEILSYMAIFFTYACQEQLKNGNTASLNETRKNIRQAVIRVSGIDLSKYTFNNKGLIEN